ncbi:hypothetical protein GCM10011383_20060 [Hymenobacter cavernae]|uniref:Uncharacterized protein n=1 Tax=Hymenobacter cavernae TaxID=2044852 RepID=A0ABQ1U2U2_9BACT|nr:hypothetical protein GCM10011383_20060 [Hymenobacter cavernae]
MTLGRAAQTSALCAAYSTLSKKNYKSLAKANRSFVEGRLPSIAIDRDFLSEDKGVITSKTSTEHTETHVFETKRSQTFSETFVIGKYRNNFSKNIQKIIFE